MHHSTITRAENRSRPTRHSVLVMEGVFDMMDDPVTPSLPQTARVGPEMSLPEHHSSTETEMRKLYAE